MESVSHRSNARNMRRAPKPIYKVAIPNFTNILSYLNADNLKRVSCSSKGLQGRVEEAHKVWVRGLRTEILSTKKILQQNKILFQFEQLDNLQLRAEGGSFEETLHCWQEFKIILSTLKATQRKILVEGLKLDVSSRIILDGSVESFYRFLDLSDVQLLTYFYQGTYHLVNFVKEGEHESVHIPNYRYRVFNQKVIPMIAQRRFLEALIVVRGTGDLWRGIEKLGFFAAASGRYDIVDWLIQEYTEENTWIPDSLKRVKEMSVEVRSRDFEGINAHNANFFINYFYFLQEYGICYRLLPQLRSTYSQIEWKQKLLNVQAAQHEQLEPEHEITRAPGKATPPSSSFPSFRWIVIALITSLAIFVTSFIGKKIRDSNRFEGLQGRSICN